MALIIGMVSSYPATRGKVGPNTLVLPGGIHVPIQKTDFTTFSGYQPGELWAGGSPVEACAACDMSSVSGSPGGQSVQPGQDVDPGTGDFTTSNDLFSAPAIGGSLGMTMTYSSDLSQYQYENATQTARDDVPFFGNGWQSSAVPSLYVANDGSSDTVNEENGSEVTFDPVSAGSNCPTGDYLSSAKYTVPGSPTSYCAPYRVDAQLGTVAYGTLFDEEGGKSQLFFGPMDEIACQGSLLDPCGVGYDWDGTPSSGSSSCPLSLSSGTVVSCLLMTDTGGRTTSIQMGAPTGFAGFTDNVIGVTDPEGHQYIWNWALNTAVNVSSIEIPYDNGLWSYGYQGGGNEYEEDMTSIENPDSHTMYIGYNATGMATSKTDFADQFTTYYSYLNTSCGDCAGGSQEQLTTVTYPDGETDIDNYFEGLLTGDSFGSSNPQSPAFETVTYNYEYPAPGTAHQDDPINEIIIHPGAAQNVEQTHITTDAVGNILSVTDANGNTTTNFYNDSGSNNLDEVCWSAPPGASLPAQTCSPSSPPPGVTSWQYDAYGNVVSETDPIGNTTHYGYYTGASGEVYISYSNDLCWVALPTVVNGGLGLPCTSSPSGAAPIGSSADSYDSYGDVTTKYVDYADSEQTTSTAVFDADNNLSSSYPPDAYATGINPGSPNAAYQSLYGYSPGNLLFSSILPGPNGLLGTEYLYDPATDELTTQNDPTGDTTNTYYPDGQLCWSYRSTVDSNAPCGSPPSGGSLTKYQYFDDTDAQTTVTDPNTNTTTSSYGDIAYPDSPTEIRDPMGAAIVYNTYDADGNTCVTGPVPTSTCQWAAGDTFTTYDGLGNVLSSTDPNGNMTQYGYGNPDYPNAMTASTDPQSRTTHYMYDADGRQDEVSGPAGNSTDTTTTGYDADGRTCWQAVNTSGTCTSPPTGTGATAFTYDNDGNQIRMVDNDGNTIAPLQAISTYSYDNDGKLISKTDDNGNVVSYSYDDSSDVTCIAYPVLNKQNCANAPGAKNSVVDLGYNPEGLLTSTKEWLGNKTTYAYSTDGLANVTKITYPNNGTAETVTYGYDADSNLKTADYAGPVTIAGSKDQSWTYNSDELVDATAQIGGFSSSPSYDSTQGHKWVATATNPATPAGPDSYGYNPNGEIASDLPTGSAATNYGYDSADELTSQTKNGATDEYAYTPDGQRCWSAATTISGPSCTSPPSGATSYGWNAFGQLCWSGQTSLTGSCGAPPSGTTTYTYDGQGQRMTETAGSSTSQFTWDTVSGGGTPLLLDDGTNAYIYGPLLFGGTAPVEQISGNGVTYLTSAPSGVQLAFSQAKVNLNQSLYSTYGLQANSAPSSASPFGFQGGYTDASGLVYFDSRYYDPSTDQFLSVDPDVGETGQPYAFTNDDPLNQTDPQGLGGGAGAARGFAPCHGVSKRNWQSCLAKTRRKLKNVLRWETKHWRGIAKVATAVVGVAAGVSCVASVLCGAAVGLVASATFYSAGTAGTKQFSGVALVESATGGAVLGGLGSGGVGLFQAGADEIQSVANAGLWNAVKHPIVTSGVLLQGAAKVAGGALGQGISYTGQAATYIAGRE